MSTDPTEVAQTETPAPEAPIQEQTPVEQPAESTPVANEQITNDRVPKRSDIVDFVLSEGNHAGEVRPAIIVKVWGDKPDSLVNLQVLTDGVNDFISAHPAVDGMWWWTSVVRDDS